MKQFEYHVTRHPVSEFSQLAYVCSANGECERSQIPSDQLETMDKLLNEKGKDGWELVQLAFSQQALVVFWKRELNPGV